MPTDILHFSVSSGENADSKLVSRDTSIVQPSKDYEGIRGIRDGFVVKEKVISVTNALKGNRVM